MSASRPPMVDARGLKCPLPVFKAQKHVETVAPGESFTLVADDPVARIDIPLFCKQEGHACAVSAQGSALAFTITRAG